MKKEVVVAILIGLTLGLVVTYGVYRARTSLLNLPATQTTGETPSPTPSSSPHNTLTLLSPSDESVQNTKDVKVTGTTDPDATVVIFVNDKVQVTTADKSGNFSLQTQLNSVNGGSNVITVRTIDENGNTAEEQRTVIFDTVPLEDLTGSASGSATLASPTPAPTPLNPFKRFGPRVSPSPSNTTGSGM